VARPLPAPPHRGALDRQRQDRQRRASAVIRREAPPISCLPSASLLPCCVAEKGN
jgi:hypothetical protein